MHDLRVGISGWNYPGWRGRFYPKGLPQKQELEYATSQFNSIEINGTFYSLKRPRDFMAWRDRAPEEHVFAVKAGRYITHMKRLADVEAPLANFFASGVLALEKKLGPILWQFPPTMSYAGEVPERFERFLGMLPRTLGEAARLADHHDRWMSDRAFLEPRARTHPIRHAVEIRHPSFVSREFVSLLKSHGVALVVADTGGKFPALEERTTDFMYVRLHGPEELYASGYDGPAIGEWARKVAAWKRKGDVFVYFDNDAKVHAPFDARALIDRIEALEAPRRRAA